MAGENSDSYLAAPGSHRFGAPVDGDRLSDGLECALHHLPIRAQHVRVKQDLASFRSTDAKGRPQLRRQFWGKATSSLCCPNCRTRMTFPLSLK